jgi:hypothetical protein
LSDRILLRGQVWDTPGNLITPQRLGTAGFKHSKKKYNAKLSDMKSYSYILDILSLESYTDKNGREKERVNNNLKKKYHKKIAKKYIRDAEKLGIQDADKLSIYNLAKSIVMKQKPLQKKEERERTKKIFF